MDLKTSEIPADFSNSIQSKFHQYKAQFYSKFFTFSWWKVDILTHALSAMDNPPDFYAIQCKKDPFSFAGYSPDKHAVWICSNYVHNPFEFRRLVAHQLVHAFDYSRSKITTNRHKLCSEIRAVNLSGEKELWANWMKYLGDDPLAMNMSSRKKREVKISALRNIRKAVEKEDIPNVNLDADEIFDKCWNDYYPFTTSPHLDNRFRDKPYIDASHMK